MVPLSTFLRGTKPELFRVLTSELINTPLRHRIKSSQWLYLTRIRMNIFYLTKTTVLPLMFFFMTTNKKQQCYPLFFFMMTNNKQQCYPLFFSWRTIKNDSVTPYVFFMTNNKKRQFYPLFFFMTTNKKQQSYPLCFFHDDQ